MARIEDLLHRRTDLSTFLVHFTRTKEGEAARLRLLRILGERRLRFPTAASKISAGNRPPGDA